MPPVVARLRVVLPPFHRALHSRHTYTLASVSFHTLGLSLFSGSCPNLGFRPVRHGRTPRFGPERRAEQPSRRSPRCSSPTPVLPSIPFGQAMCRQARLSPAARV